MTALKRMANSSPPAKPSLSHTPDLWLAMGVALAMLAGLLLPLNLLAAQRFHHDEALYATWALEIASGENPTLYQTPIDKPPLFLYLVAGSLRLFGSTESAARLPSLAATTLTIGLTFWLGYKLYGSAVGLLAAWLAALSPFTILFTPTAFTDPVLVMFGLAACVAAVYGRGVWAGIFTGLAIATKQQGIFFMPQTLALLILGDGGWGSGSGDLSDEKKCKRRKLKSLWRNFVPGIIFTLLPIFLWDLARNPSPGFWQLSLINYGGLTTPVGQFGERWVEFINLLSYATASPVLNIFFVAGLPILLGYGIIRQRLNRFTQKWQSTYFDRVFVLFALGFLLVHTWFSFQIWDRYLLGLIPFLALLLARVLLLPWHLLRQYALNKLSELLSISRALFALILISLLGLTLARPVQDAVNGRYPLGSHSHALSGIEQIVAYLQGTTTADTTLYHQYLGTHWRFYLWQYPYDLQYWSSAEELAGHAQPGHLIAFPAWRSETEARLALAETDLDLQEITRSYTAAGNPSILLYQIIKKE